MCKENMEIIAFASDNVPTSEYISHGIVLVWCCCRRGSVKLISHIHDGREAGKVGSFLSFPFVVSDTNTTTAVILGFPLPFFSFSHRLLCFPAHVNFLFSPKNTLLFSFGLVSLSLCSLYLSVFCVNTYFCRLSLPIIILIK